MDTDEHGYQAFAENPLFTRKMKDKFISQSVVY